jgi:radical SAM/Cys-rich protein
MAWAYICPQSNGAIQVGIGEMRMNDFDRKVQEISRSDLRASDISIVQANVGLRCNNSCTHCHLEAGPSRTEMMDWDTMRAVVDIANRTEPEFVDITGGSPELNPLIHRFVSTLRAEGHEVQLRTNLTVACEPRMEELIQFYRDTGVKLVASLPCYTQVNVDTQRGQGVYEKSIKALKRLNAAGYGSNPDLILDLVYNPGGAVLPGEQSQLESDYKANLGEEHGIVFNNLRTITNMPIGRFERVLARNNELEQYNILLKESFNPATLEGLMCRYQIEVAWDGVLYDCDFNLALKMPINNGVPARAKDFDVNKYSKRKVITGNHCFGCTAGHGSSCSGALDSKKSVIPVPLQCKA